MFIELICMKLRSHQQTALDAMFKYNRGQVIIPTGGGKTITMILDCQRKFSETVGQVAVVVAPRILLAEQLCSEFMEFHTNVDVLHVHSGETHYNRTTKSDKIANYVLESKTNQRNLIIFTTYHSLNRVVDSGTDITVLYCDESHNATQKSRFIAVAAASLMAEYAYFFTATPRHTRNPQSSGMNNSMVYGQVICNVPAPELINNGSIIPPSLVPFEVDITREKSSAAQNDRDMILEIIDQQEGNPKVLVAAPNTKIMWAMLTQTNIMQELHDRGYDVLQITSKHGAYVNKKKVNREVFFDTLTQYGKDESRKFVLLHYSILSEGINVPGLTHTILLRNLPVIEMAQTIGRVIRVNRHDAQDIADGKIPAGAVHMYRKPCGYVTVPVFKNYGKQTIRRLQSVIDTIFVKGYAATSVVG